MESCQCVKNTNPSSCAPCPQGWAPLWPYTVIGERLTQVPSVRCFCQPQFGSILPLQSIKGHFDFKDKLSGDFRGTVMSHPPQLCQFTGLIQFKRSLGTRCELLGSSGGWSGAWALGSQQLMWLLRGSIPFTPVFQELNPLTKIETFLY